MYALVITVALALHLVAIFLGYRFHIWLIENGSSSSSSWFNFGQETSSSSTSLSNQQIALLHTFSFWLLVVGFVCQWRHEILLVIFVGLILLQRQYPIAGLPESLLCFGISAFLAWMALLAFTVSLFLWSCDTFREIFAEGEEGLLYYKFLWIACIIVLVVAGLIAATIHIGKRGNQDFGIVTDFVAV